MPTKPPIPTTPDEIDLDWIIAALRSVENSPNSLPTSMDAQSIGEGISASGVLTRLTLTYADGVQHGPESMVLKMPMPASNPNGASVRKQGVYPREIRFYTDLAPDCPITVPRLFYADHDPESGDAVLIIEDLAPARPGDNAIGCTDAEALQIVSDLGKFHAWHWAAEIPDDIRWLEKNGLVALVNSLMRARWPEGRDRFVGEVPDELIKLGDRFMDGENPLAWIEEPPITLFHGDFRIDNMYMRDGTSPLEITYADFQRIGIGRGSTDLAVFAVMTLNVDQRTQIEDQLLAAYLNALTDNGVKNYNSDDLNLDYRRGVAFVALRTLVAQLVFTDAASGRGDAMLRMLTALEDLDAIAALD